MVRVLCVVFTFFALLTTAAVVRAELSPESAKRWSELSNGEHSFKTLGKDFYVNVPVRRIENARVRLAFVNRPILEKLGLDLPDDPEAVEQFLLDHFAWEVDPTKKSEKVWFATRYRDSLETGEGSARGDGRALWTGELKLRSNDGAILYIDAVQKGVGVTPLAWLNNPTHSDGKQTTNELVHSAINSMADHENQLDSTSDAVGFVIQGADGQFRSMTLRLGRQTRPAHIKYFARRMFDLEKIMDYIVKRDLGLSLETKVTPRLFYQWEEKFTRGLAENTARVFALHAFFEQPSMGNKTTTGGNIDLNGRVYLDAYHTKLTHLYHEIKLEEQIKVQADYLEWINYYLRKADYRPFTKNFGIEEAMQQRFYDIFEKTTAKLYLHSLGLSKKEIGRVPRRVRDEIGRTVYDLMYALGNESVPSMMLDTKDVVPAAFEVRKILSGTMEAFAKPIAERKAAMAELYRVDRSWARTDENAHADLKAEYESAVGALVRSMGGRVKPEWIEAARVRTKLERTDAISDGVWEKWANPIRELIERGGHWQDVTNEISKAARSYVDPDQPPLRSGMLLPGDEKAPVNTHKPAMCVNIFARMAG